MPYLGAIKKNDKMAYLFPRQTISKTTSQKSSSMTQLLIPKKLKLNGSVKTYKTFKN